MLLSAFRLIKVRRGESSRQVGEFWTTIAPSAPDVGLQKRALDLSPVLTSTFGSSPVTETFSSGTETRQHWGLQPFLTVVVFHADQKQLDPHLYPFPLPPDPLLPPSLSPRAIWCVVPVAGLLPRRSGGLPASSPPAVIEHSEVFHASLH